MSLYGPDYFMGRDDPRRAVMMRQERLRVAGITRNRCGTVLDIGCGQGEFLELFDGRRFGIEIADTAPAVKRGVSFELPQGDGWADLVVMRGVLQHLPNPVGMLQTAHRYLRPGGWLAILATPDAASVCFRIWQTLPALDPPRVYHTYTADEIGRTLAGIGFRDLHMERPYRRTPYARPARDFARFLTGRMPNAFPGNMLEMYARK